MKVEKTKEIQPKAEKEELDVKALEEKLTELKRKELEDAANKINEFAESLGVTVGLQMTVEKLMDVTSFMIRNNKPVITLRFEVWKQ